MTVRQAVVRAGHLLTAAAAARVGYRLLTASPPGGAVRWQRTNHRGEQVTLLEGPAYAAAAAYAAALTPGLSGRLRAAGALAALGAAGFGLVDDLAGSAASKGLRGHLGELARGRLTTGGLKVLGIGGTGLLAAALARTQLRSGSRSGAGTSHGGAATALDVAVAGALVAGSANLANLFDLRPGRALKMVLLSAPAVAGAGPAAGLVGAACAPAAALLPEDLAERAMLGDTGANAAGALLGVAACAGLGRSGRLVTLAAVAGLTLVSERISFTRVIARTPVLRELDALGRRPAEPARA